MIRVWHMIWIEVALRKWAEQSFRTTKHNSHTDAKTGESSTSSIKCISEVEPHLGGLGFQKKSK